jgi:hypothetical protein
LPNAWRPPGRRIEKATLSVVVALVWPQRRPYKKTTARCLESINIPSRPTYDALARNGSSFRSGVCAEENAGSYGAKVGTDIR